MQGKALALDLEHIVATPQQVSTHLGEESVILHLASGSYFGLNETGAFIWQLIQTPRTLAEICAAVAAEYNIEAQTCQPEVCELLEHLAAAQLLTQEVA
jgi:hypothetical protein